MSEGSHGLPNLEIASATQSTEVTEKNRELSGSAKEDRVSRFAENWPEALFSVGSVTSVAL
jgi:hypothetical protein